MKIDKEKRVKIEKLDNIKKSPGNSEKNSKFGPNQPLA